MTDIVERLRERLLAPDADYILDEAADAIVWLRARVAAARREALEEAIEAAMRVPIPEDASVAEAHGRLAAAQDICARIGAAAGGEQP